MGFMAGFGPAFSRSFEQGMDRNAQRRDDLFKMTYADLIAQRDKKDEWDREVRKNTKAAEAAMQLAGKNDPEALALAYKWTEAGYSPEKIVENLKTGTYKRGSGISSAQRTETSARVDSVNSVDTQMSESGMAPESSAVESTANAGPLTSFMKRLMPSTESRRSRALNDAAEAAGMDPETARETMSGDYSPQTAGLDASGIEFTPAPEEIEPDKFASGQEAYIEERQARTAAERDPSPDNLERHRMAQERVAALQAWSLHEAEMKAKSEGITLGGQRVTLWSTDEQGQRKYVTNARVKDNGDGTYTNLQTQDILPAEDVVPIDDAEIKAMEKIDSSLGKPLNEHVIRASNAEGAIRAFGVMSDLVEQSDGQVLAKITPSLLQTAQSWVVDATTAASQISNIAQQEGGVLPEGEISRLEEWEKRLLNEGNPNDLATQAGLFEIQKAILAYRLAGSMGQEGRSLAEAERKLFTEIASGGVTVDRFQQGMSNLLVNAVRDIDSQGQMIMDTNPDLRTFEAVHDYIPKQYQYEPIQKKLATTVDPQMKKAWATLTQNDIGGTVIPDTLRNTPPEIPAGPPPGTTKTFNGQTYEYQGGNPKDQNSWKVVQ